LEFCRWFDLPLSADVATDAMIYQLGWSTLPGLRGLSVSEFRAAPTDAPDNERGVAVQFVSDDERDSFLREIEAAFSARRFTNAADSFDTVKAWALERAARSKGERTA
jgi:hypothetical protein